MPFVHANDRDEQALTKFFTDYIKYPIENDSKLGGIYSVIRSSDSFLMLDQIISDLGNADIVICDLSGENANPNVMFELGVRLAVSHKPVILIREKKDSNKRIFDVSGLFAHEYSMQDTRALDRFLVSKVSEYEFENLSYSSPILKILNHDAAFWMQLPIRKASAFLGGIASAAEAHLHAFSKALAVHLIKAGLVDVSISPGVSCYRDIANLNGSGSLFDNFQYNITAIPSLDSYLSSVYLLGLIDDEIERGFREYAMNYSLYFNKSNSSYFWPSKFEECFAYAFETLILMNLARQIIKTLNVRADSLDRIGYVEKFHEDLNKSHFKKDVG
ncbi:hypothetical protein RugamoR64_33230 [Duganella rhizosphaerae]